MKNNTQPQDTEPKAKMLFNSDGFEFLVKFMTVLFTIIGAVLVMFMKILFAFCDTKTNDNITKSYVSLDPLKTEGENKINGTGHYKIDN